MKKLYSILSVFTIALFATSCVSDIETMEGEEGYLKLAINTDYSTNTRAVANKPSNYNPTDMEYRIYNATGTVDMDQDKIESSMVDGSLPLAPGTYTIDAHSANWDGSGSGYDAPYYAGSTTVTIKKGKTTEAEVICTQANVKVTINFDKSFTDNFLSALVYISSSIKDVAAQPFIMGTSSGSVYFPVGDLTLLLSTTNKMGISNSYTKTISDTKARDHYIINYKMADAGDVGDINITVDDEMQEYTFEIEVPRKSSTSLEASNNVNAWSNFAELSGTVTAKTDEFDASAVTLQYKKDGAEDWVTIGNSQLTQSDDTYSCKVTELEPNTKYNYRLIYSDGENTVNSNTASFKTEEQKSIYNNGFEYWHKEGTCWYPNESGISYWDSSNPGPQQLSMTAKEVNNVTTQETAIVHNGASSAKLETKNLASVLAAASLYTGSFAKLLGTSGAELNWGVPFTSRPSSLTGYMKYVPVAINKGSKPNIENVAGKGDMDNCQIYCALLNLGNASCLKAANASNEDGYEMTTEIDWETDPRVIAYGQITQNTVDTDWKAFNIPLIYHDTTKKPTHMLIVCSSSKWGDYFYGGIGSTLYLDDFSFEYGKPTVK